MKFDTYDMEGLKKQLKKYGVPKKLNAFGNQVHWNIKNVKENALDEFMEFLGDWGVKEVCPAGQWGNSMVWSLLDTGLGLANLTWNDGVWTRDDDEE